MYYNREAAENYKDTVFYRMHATEERKRHVMLNSLKGEGIAYFVFKVGNNEYVFMTESGYLAHAIFNPFVCMYYVDDMYAIMNIDEALDMLEKYNPNMY